MISIRKYLDSYRRTRADAGEPPQPEKVAPEDLGFQASLARLATVLVSEMGVVGRDETDPAFERYSASIGDIQQRLGTAQSPDDIQALSVAIPEVLQEFRSAKQAVDQRQTEEVRKIVAMLQQTIEALSRGSDRSVSRLRRIEGMVRSASQLSEIVALRDRLRSCVDQIREEAAVEQREFAKAKSDLERDFLLAQESAALARGGIPGRSQAEQRIAEGPGAASLALVLLEHLPAIKARYGAGVGERYFSGFLGELTERLPQLKKVFRWNERTLMVELPVDASGGIGEAELRACLTAMPRALQVDVGGRVAVLESTHRWCLIPAGTQPADILQRIEDFLKV